MKLKLNSVIVGAAKHFKRVLLGKVVSVLNWVLYQLL